MRPRTYTLKEERDLFVAKIDEIVRDAITNEHWKTTQQRCELVACDILLLLEGDRWGCPKYDLVIAEDREDREYSAREGKPRHRNGRRISARGVYLHDAYENLCHFDWKRDP
jgi:hypothetical protein